jgi:tripartite-type tricarboxylate transporter receptor subunit TctC
MLGGAHIVASNHVFNTARPDGLTLLAANPNIAIAQLIKVEGVRFDVRKFEWLGSSGSDGVVLTIRSDLPYKTFEELRKADRELVVGTTGPGSNAHDFPLLLKEFAGAKFKFVSGYPANSDILLAIERKEVDVWPPSPPPCVPWLSAERCALLSALGCRRRDSMISRWTTL